MRFQVMEEKKIKRRREQLSSRTTLFSEVMSEDVTRPQKQTAD